jgi:uncharacterized protein (UPF0332 family)
VKPQTEAFLDKARELLRQAEIMVGVNLWDAAGRAAYLSGFHAAQALIFDRTDKVVKTHSGVHAEFARLTKDDGALDMATRAFLGRAYNLKSIADYETGPGSTVSRAQASEALEAAKLFADNVAKLLAGT